MPSWHAVFFPFGRKQRNFFCICVPWSFEKTPEEEKAVQSFPMSEEGMDSAMAWLFEMYEGQKEKWKKADKDCMHIVLEESL